MPAGLQRYHGRGHLHFLTFRCYRRLPLLKTVRARPELQPQDPGSNGEPGAPSVLFWLVK